MLTFALGIFLATGIGWDAPLACPTEASFRQLVEARLGGESPEDYSVAVQASVEESADGRYQLALHATQGSWGDPIEFTTVGLDCTELTSFAAAWAATQIDPLGLGPEHDLGMDSTKTELLEPLPEQPESTAHTEPEPEQAKPAPSKSADCQAKPSMEPTPEPTPAESSPKVGGLLGAAGGMAFSFTSPAVTMLTGRVGLKWNKVQLTVGGHGFIDSALARVPAEALVHRPLVVWSVGPELCWTPRVNKVLLWGCAHFDGGQLHLESDLEPGKVYKPWIRVGANAAIGFQAGRLLQPFVSFGFSHVLFDVKVDFTQKSQTETVTETIIKPIGAFAFVSIGANFIIRRNRTPP